MLKAASAGNLTFSGNIDSNSLDLTSTKGAIALTGNVTGGTVGGILVASAPQGNIRANAAGNDIFATAGVTPTRQLRVTMVLRAAASGAVPSATRVGLVWTCP